MGRTRIKEFANRNGLDRDGFIYIEVDSAKIQTPFSQMVDEMKNEALSIFEEILHSVYLYGSIATGKAQLYTSDADLLFVLRSKATPEVHQEIDTFQREASARYRDIAREVGISRTDVHEVEADPYG